jgi:hypothetical protein
MEHTYKNDAEIAALVSAFELCSFHPSEFRHYQHLTVGLWYVWHLSFADATEKVTTGIRRLARTYGKTGYHETITLFWLRIVANFVAERRRTSSLVMTANALIGNYNDKNFIRKFYSEELLDSAKAKAEWVEPDVQPLPVIEIQPCAPT